MLLQTQSPVCSLCLQSLSIDSVPTVSTSLKQNQTCPVRINKRNAENPFSFYIIFQGSARNCDESGFLSEKPHIWATSEHKGCSEWAILSHCLSNRPSRLLEAASTGAEALTNAFCLLCRGTVDCIVFGFISYLMQCNWGDKINQGDDTILDVRDESSSRVIAECIFQRCWPQEVTEVKSLSNKTNLPRARMQVSRVRLASLKWIS